MGMRINSRRAALDAQRQLSGASRGKVGNLERTASGLGISRAKDDAAGLAIAEHLRSEVRRSEQEARNLQYGFNASRAAGDGLRAQQEGLVRLRELALQASNGALTGEQRAAIDEEARRLVGELDATARQTGFGGRSLLNGDARSMSLGIEGSLELNINESTAAALGIGAVDLTTPAGASNAHEALDAAVARLDENLAAAGAQERRFARAIEQRQTGTQTGAGAVPYIRGIDAARQAIGRARTDILQKTELAALTQSNLQAEAAALLLGT